MRILRTWVWIVVATLLVACSMNFGGLRGHTYPPNFNYISQEQLEGTMWRLAAQASQLDRLMRDGGEPGAALRLAVIELLLEMEETSAALGQEGWPSNHPRVSRNLGAFREDIARARVDVEAEPPNYFFAGSISGSCVRCHEDGG